MEVVGSTSSVFTRGAGAVGVADRALFFVFLGVEGASGSVESFDLGAFG